MTKKVKLLSKTNTEFQNIINELIVNQVVLEMKNYRHHYSTTRFEHCYSSSFYCYLICKKLHLDYISAARAAMLHDLFLYDCRIKNSYEGSHALNHPKIAYNNACKLFDLNKKEKDIITKHMWPLTIKLPKYPESFILTLVDKYCATVEFLQYCYSTKTAQRLQWYVLISLTFYNKYVRIKLF